MSKLISRKAGWIVALAAVLLFAYQQAQLNTSRRNERAADEQLSESQRRAMRLSLEVAALTSVVDSQQVYIMAAPQPVSKGGAR